MIVCRGQGGVILAFFDGLVEGLHDVQLGYYPAVGTRLFSIAHPPGPPAASASAVL